VRADSDTVLLEASGLEEWDFAQVAKGGFGDPLNSFAHSMVWFGDHLYVGTTRANLCIRKTIDPPPHYIWPVKCPDDVYDLDRRSQIWRFDPRRGEWSRVFISPMVERTGGPPVTRDIGYRSMTVFQGQNDPSPALYVCTWAASRSGRPAIVMRSTDGESFVPVSAPRTDRTLTTYRTLVSFRDRLYTTPTGRALGWQGSQNLGAKANESGAAVVLGSVDPSSEEWQVVSQPGFGDPTNTTVFEMAPFNGCLYAATLNPTGGFQLWRSALDGPPYSWTKVIDRGAHRGPLNEAGVSMCAFRDALYVGTGIQDGGYDRTYKVGPGAAELIRIHPDDSWDLIVGEARSTPKGWRRPLSGFGPGFDSLSNGYFWRMAAHDGHLYVGTFNWSVLLPYLRPREPNDPGANYIRWLGIDNVVQFSGGFDLFRSSDGVEWTPVTTSGFGNPYNLGARTMVSSPYGLFVGTANAFGPEVAARTAAGWQYVPNERGGLEVWLGRKPLPGRAGESARLGVTGTPR